MLFEHGKKNLGLNEEESFKGVLAFFVTLNNLTITLNGVKPPQLFKPTKHSLLPFDSAQGKLAQYKLPHVTRLSLVGDNN